VFIGVAILAFFARVEEPSGTARSDRNPTTRNSAGSYSD
jgi:hypothetical protein